MNFCGYYFTVCASCILCILWTIMLNKTIWIWIQPSSILTGTHTSWSICISWINTISQLYILFVTTTSVPVRLALVEAVDTSLDWIQNKMDDVLQTTFSNTFHWKTNFMLRTQFHWNEFLRGKILTLCHQTTSHYFNQCWPSFMTPYGITGSHWVNTKQAANHCVFHWWKWLLISARYPYTESRFKHRLFHQYTYIRDGIIITSIQQTMFYYDNMAWSGDYNLSRPTSRCHDSLLWRHQMETFSALLAFCAVNSPVTGEFPAQRPVTRSFDAFFDLCPNKRLSKQSWGW